MTMLYEDFQHSLWILAPVLLLCWSLFVQKHFLVSRLLAIVSGVLLAVFLYDIPFETVLYAAEFADLLDAALLFFLWMSYTHLCAANGGVRQIGPIALYPFLCGFLMGEWGAALFLAPLAKDKASAARLILGACAGGFCGGWGSLFFFLVGIHCFCLLRLFCMCWSYQKRMIL